MSHLLDDVGRNIRTRGLLRRGQQVLVAVSGGVDSMVLLNVLHQLAPRNGWRLTVAHLNHQLRGRSSDADERLVRRTAEKLKLPVLAERAEVRKFARRNRLSLEMAARRLRHDFLARTAAQLGIKSIALAHHADDQLELFFLRLLRGSGGEGLAGMKWRNPSPCDPAIELIRPLLDQPKSALRRYARQRRIRFREDATNSRLEIQRNRVRHELLPFLRGKYQAALDKTILRTMDIVGAEAELVNQEALDWLERKGISVGQASSLSPTSAPQTKTGWKPVLRPGNAEFESLPVAVQRRCVQLQLIGQGIAPGYELVERLRRDPRRAVSVRPPKGQAGQLLQEAPENAAYRPRPRRRPRNRSFKIPDDDYNDEDKEHGQSEPGKASGFFSVVRDLSGQVRVQEAESIEFEGGALEAELQGRAGELNFDGAQIEWRTDSRRPPAKPKLGPRRECFDADKVGSPVLLRHWHAGDRFQPIGFESTVKLQDFFTNLKVPRERRHQLIVAATARGEVFWVEGLRIGERFKLAKETIRRLHWRWQRL